MPAFEYTFTLLKPSHYTLTVSGKGFKTAMIEEFALAAGDRAREDAHLTVGSESQVVQVEAQAPALKSDSSVSFRCDVRGIHQRFYYAHEVAILFAVVTDRKARKKTRVSCSLP